MFFLLVPLLALYVLGGLYLVGRCAVAFEGRKAKVVVALLLFLVLYGDELLTYFTWRYDCSNKAGMFVYERTPVKIFFYPDLSEAFVDSFLKRGYSAVEGTDFPDKENDKSKIYYRFSKDSEGRKTKETVRVLESEFRYSTRQGIEFPHVDFTRSAVESVSDGKVIGETLIYKYAGGWALRLLKSIARADQEGSAQVCTGNIEKRNLINEVIPPAK